MKFHFQDLNHGQRVSLLPLGILALLLVLYPESETEYFLWRGQGEQGQWYCFHREIRREFILNALRHPFEKPRSFGHSGFRDALVATVGEGAVGGALNWKGTSGLYLERRRSILIFNIILQLMAITSLSLLSLWALSKSSSPKDAGILGISGGLLLLALIYGALWEGQTKKAQQRLKEDMVSIVRAVKSMESDVADMRTELSDINDSIEDLKAR